MFFVSGAFRLARWTPWYVRHFSQLHLRQTNVTRSTPCDHHANYPTQNAHRQSCRNLIRSSMILTIRFRSIVRMKGRPVGNTLTLVVVKTGSSQTNPLFAYQAAYLHTWYCALQITVHRSFIPMPRRPSSLSFPSLAICTNAARSCIHVLDRLYITMSGVAFHSWHQVGPLSSSYLCNTTLIDSHCIADDAVHLRNYIATELVELKAIWDWRKQY